MPNWVMNKVTFYGNDNEIQKMKNFLKSKDTAFDFNKLIPMPEELDIDSGSTEHFSIELYELNEKNPAAALKLYEESSWQKDKTFGQWLRLGEKYISNKKKYGHPTWYGWRCENWGTKWNASEIVWDGNNVEFWTAWDTCEPIYRRLAELYPTVQFDVEYANEDVAAQNGEFHYDAEEFWENPINTEEFGCKVWEMESEYAYN